MQYVVGQDETELEKCFHNLCQKVVYDCNLILYGLEFNKHSSTLRLYIMDEKTKTVAIEDCVRVDRALSPCFEEESGNSWMPDSITLEVSSPGMFRELKTLEHFNWAIGERVAVVLFYNLEAQGLSKKLKKSKKVVGLLKEATNKCIKLEIEEQLIEVNYTNIKKANLEPQVFKS
ncbi:MAG: hypothetical protein ISR65_12205 [Bacteriovoracaceae bacterium]|nr:hypothetical protein [Bacteriovoracaceae bacterium]